MTIKLEAGKYYKRRDGEKVYCVGIAPYVIAREKHTPLLYSESGISEFGYADESSDCDIIAEWVDEPDLKTHKFDTSGYIQIPEQKLNISEWWVGVCIKPIEDVASNLMADTTLFIRSKDTLTNGKFDYILQVKDWIAVQMGLKDIEEFKV